MQKCFSVQLVEKTIAHFKRRGTLLSPEQAELYLDNLATFYKSLQRKGASTASAPPRSRSGRRAMGGT